MNSLARPWYFRGKYSNKSNVEHFPLAEKRGFNMIHVGY